MRGLAIALALFVIVTVAVSAAGQEFYYDYRPVDRPFDPTWPPDGDEWHQLQPNYCIYDEQTDHDDADGNGYIDVCEHIWFNGERHHVEWIGPTYKLVYIGEPPGDRPVSPKYAEDAVPGSRQHVYHEVYPVFCNEFGTTEPIEYECQEIWIEFPPEDVGWWHVEEINTNIRTVPDPSPVDEGTWSRIKGWFRSMID